MSKTLKGIGIAIIIGVVFIIMTMLVTSIQTVQGSVSVTDEYRATTTGEFMTAEGTGAIMTIVSRSPMLGSIVITGLTTGEMFVYDATTTDITLRAATFSTSSITRVHIPPSLAVGVYTFDIQMDKGLIIETVGTAPTTTITYR